MIKFTGDEKLLKQLNYEYNGAGYWTKTIQHKQTKEIITCMINTGNKQLSFNGTFKYHKVFLNELGENNYVFL